MDIDLKVGLCKVFCDEITVRDVSAGLAVSTGFDGPRGDPIGFYVVGPDEFGRFRVQDDGRTMPYIEAAGADLANTSRRQSLMELLSEYGAEYDDESFELHTDAVPPDQLPSAAMRFVAMMLRVQDLLFMTQERVATTFREDVISRLGSTVGESVTILENDSISPELAGYEADIVLVSPDNDPVAVFLATYDSKIQEAIILQLIAQHEAHIPCKVVALLEAGGSVTSKMRQRADNRLDAVPVFRGDEKAAIARIQKLATGEAPIIH